MQSTETVFRGTYDRKSWLEYKVEELGKYRIKAFVRDTESGEKISEVIPYVLKEKYAWKLAEALRKDPPPDGEIGISLEKLSPGVFRSTADEQGGSYVWTVFREGEEKAEFERGPNENPILVYAVLANGYYHVELVAEVREKLLKLFPKRLSLHGRSWKVTKN